MVVIDFPVPAASRRRGRRVKAARLRATSLHMAEMAEDIALAAQFMTDAQATTYQAYLKEVVAKLKTAQTQALTFIGDHNGDDDNDGSAA